MTHAHRVRLLTALLTLLPVTAANAQRSERIEFHTQKCPIPAHVRGYPVSVRAADGVTLDSVYAWRLAEAVVRRWEVPNHRPGDYAGLDDVRDLTIPPVPLWSDSWKPKARHVAHLSITIGRDGSVRSAELLEKSGDGTFDRSLETIAGLRKRQDPLTPAPIPFPFPFSVQSDSVRVLVSFGTAAAEDLAVVRFAAQQRPARLVQGSLRMRPGVSWTMASPMAGISAIIKYDIDEKGAVVPESVQILRASDPAFARDVTESLIGASYRPALADCNPIRRSVVGEYQARLAR